MESIGLEGEFSEVMRVIEEAHSAIHAMGCVSLSTSSRRY